MDAHERDLLAEWMKLGREVLDRNYPGARYAVFVIEMGEGIPATRLVVTPSSSPSSSASPLPLPQHGAARPLPS